MITPTIKVGNVSISFETDSLPLHKDSLFKLVFTQNDTKLKEDQYTWTTYWCKKLIRASKVSDTFLIDTLEDMKWGPEYFIAHILRSQIPEANYFKSLPGDITNKILNLIEAKDAINLGRAYPKLHKLVLERVVFAEIDATYLAKALLPMLPRTISRNFCCDVREMIDSTVKTINIMRAHRDEMNFVIT